MTHTRPVEGSAQVVLIALRRRTPERRRQTLEDLRRLAVQLDTASALERRAARTVSPALAGMLRERAAERRRIAAIVRAHLVAEGLAVHTHRGPRPDPSAS